MIDWVEVETDRFVARFDQGDVEVRFIGQWATLTVASASYRFAPGADSAEDLSIAFEDDESREGWITAGEDVYRFEDDPHDAGRLVFEPEGAMLMRQFAPWEESLAAAKVRLRVEIFDSEVGWPTLGVVAGALVIAGRMRPR